MTGHRKHPRFHPLGTVAPSEDFAALPTMISPEDGAATRQGSVSVIGKVRDPGLGAMIEGNGVRALVYGRRFEARVPLFAGSNLVSATVATSMAP